MKKIIAFIPLLIFISSCSGQSLSREKAKGIICKAQHIPFNQTEVLHVTYLVSNKGEGMHVCFIQGVEDYPGAQTALTYFVGNGLIALSDRATHGNCEIVYKDLSLTEQGKKYAVGFNQAENTYSIKLCDIVFGDVTGILMAPTNNYAQVDYTLKSANVTPFGEYYRAKDAYHVPILLKRTVMLVKYDDGWRVQQ